MSEYDELLNRLDDTLLKKIYELRMLKYMNFEKLIKLNICVLEELDNATTNVDINRGKTKLLAIGQFRHVLKQLAIEENKLKAQMLERQAGIER